MIDIRIAAAVMHSPIYEVDKNLQKIDEMSSTASEKGAKIICFPELCVTGYVSREEIADAAQPVPGPITARLEKISQKNNIVILAGLPEKGEHDEIFASHLVITPEGLKGKYRKLHIAPPEKSTFKQGEEVPVFDVAGIRFGIQLCYDIHFPGLSTDMTEKGAEIIFIPHASPRSGPEEKHKSWMRHLPARAYDNSIFMVACNQVGPNNTGLVFPGVAIILSPSGETLESYKGEDEKLIIVDFTGQDIERIKKSKMGYFFRNRRPELYEG